MKEYSKGQKQAARQIVHYALRHGLIDRPGECSACGGSKKLNAHHADYGDPLGVVWLCTTCHGEEHRDTNGGKKCKVLACKADEETVRMLKALCAKFNMGVSEVLRQCIETSYLQEFGHEEAA